MRPDSLEPDLKWALITLTMTIGARLGAGVPGTGPARTLSLILTFVPTRDVG